MKISAYRDEIKTELTGGVLELELSNATLDKLINSAFREVQRYINTIKIMTIPFARCIDLKDSGISAVTAVYRAQGYNSNMGGSSPLIADPMYMTQWQILSGNGTFYNLSDWVYNYASWNTVLQVRNTMSTDLAFFYDKSEEKLYINVAMDFPSLITIEYVPRYKNVEEVTSDYWTDIIARLSIALAKVALGRVRSKYTQSNALWTLDGPTLLEEGRQELSDLREILRTQSNLMFPMD